jgi:hypothetical protein
MESWSRGIATATLNDMLDHVGLWYETPKGRLAEMVREL